MFCTNCKRIVEIRKVQGQDYYGDICTSCRKSLVHTIFQSILAKISKDF